MLEQLIGQFTHFEVEKISRILNNSIDTLAKLASTCERGEREILVDFAVCLLYNLVTYLLNDWMFPIIEYL